MSTFSPVIIVGGGASGLLLKHLLPSALLIEKNRQTGQKLLITGGGACNLTHSEDIRSLIEHYNGKRKFVSTALYSFPPEKIISFFESIGVNCITREDGKIFPSTMDAHTVRDALLNDGRGVIAKTTVREVSLRDGRYHITTTDGDYECSILVLATGGASYPATGSEGDGYAFAKALGHKIIPPHAALCALRTDMDTKPLEGISIEEVTLTLNRKKYKGPLLFTSRGLSGPMVLDLSRNIEGGEKIRLSFTEITEQDIKAQNGKLNALNAVHSLTGLPRRLLDVLLKDVAAKNTASLTKTELNLIISKLTALELTVTTKGELKYGMTTRGGIDTAEIDSRSFESKISPGLYAVGELLDVDADCGGYSLTFAFASAYAAAQSIQEKLNGNS